MSRHSHRHRAPPIQQGSMSNFTVSYTDEPPPSPNKAGRHGTQSAEVRAILDTLVIGGQWAALDGVNIEAVKVIIHYYGKQQAADGSWWKYRTAKRGSTLYVRK